MNERQTAASGGIGLGGALTVLFVGLKLAGIIDWPWTWVLAPVWVPIVFVLVVLFTLAVAYLILPVLEAWHSWRVRIDERDEEIRHAMGRAGRDEHGPCWRWSGRGRR